MLITFKRYQSEITTYIITLCIYSEYTYCNHYIHVYTVNIPIVHHYIHVYI